VSVDASHEILETAGDEGANQFANDNKGLLHAVEMCDAVEIQTYGKTCKDGTVVQVSNWLLPAWFIPGAADPYDYMSFAKISGAVSPPGPLQTAPDTVVTTRSSANGVVTSRSSPPRATS
jgi:hypothetical protein